MRTFVFVCTFLLSACIKEQGTKIPANVGDGNPDYQPYCPPLEPVPQPVTTEWKKWQTMYQFEPDGEDGDTCTIEEETER